MGMIERLPAGDNLEVRVLDHFEDAATTDVWLTSRVNAKKIIALPRRPRRGAVRQRSPRDLGLRARAQGDAAADRAQDRRVARARRARSRPRSTAGSASSACRSVDELVTVARRRRTFTTGRRRAAIARSSARSCIASACARSTRSRQTARLGLLSPAYATPPGDRATRSAAAARPRAGVVDADARPGRDRAAASRARATNSAPRARSRRSCAAVERERRRDLAGAAADARIVAAVRRAARPRGSAPPDRRRSRR